MMNVKVKLTRIGELWMYYVNESGKVSVRALFKMNERINEWTYECWRNQKTEIIWWLYTYVYIWNVMATAHILCKTQT